MLKRVFDNIVNSGTGFHSNLLDKRRVRFLNIVFLISILSSLTYSFIYIIVDVSLLLPLIICTNLYNIFFIFGIYLNRINKTYFAQHLLCISLPFINCITIFIFVGTEIYSHFYFLLFAVAPLFVWSLKQLLPIFIYFSVSTFLFIYVQFIWTPSDSFLIFPSIIAATISILTVVFTFFTLLSVLWINLDYMEENEIQLHAQSLEKDQLVLELNEKHSEILNQKEVLDNLNDILTKQNQSLTEFNATKDKFFSIISHDLRNPFSSILGFSKMLTEDIHKFDKEKIQQLVQHINNSSLQTYNLLENLLEWSRSQSGVIRFNRVIYNLASLIDETIELSKAAAANKDISIEINLDKSLVVCVDKDMFNTVIRNLLSNAIKYTNQYGMVKVMASLQDTNVLVSVSDSGVGISQSIITKIFNITEKTSEPGTNREKGSGLGLLLCKEFVEKHGGKIWVESEVGAGSKFQFTIPACE